MMVEGILILSCLIPALHFQDSTWPQILVSGLFPFNLGLLMLVRYHKYRTLANRRKAYLLVVLIWVVLALFGTLPFLTTGTLTHFADALFESMSGITSTGATVFASVEWLPASILLWRSMTQWMGGGMILMFIATVLPAITGMFGISFAMPVALKTGVVTINRLRKNTRRLSILYALLTIIGVFFFSVAGLGTYDAINY